MLSLTTISTPNQDSCFENDFNWDQEIQDSKSETDCSGADVEFESEDEENGRLIYNKTP